MKPYSFFLALIPCIAGGVSLQQVDDFSSSFSDWFEGEASDTPPTWMASGGPGGSAYLHNDSTGFSPGRNMQMWNTSQWQGDYLAAGGSAIRLNAVNRTEAGGENLNLRMAFYGEGGWFVTQPITLEPESGWQTLTYGISLSDLEHAGLGGEDYAETMANVWRMQIISLEEGADYNFGDASGLRGEPIEASLGIDDLTLIPEPSSVALLGLAGFAYWRRRR